MSLPIEKAYRSCDFRLGADFLGRMLRASRRYKRAAGFFSSSVFAVQSEAWHDFFEAGGTMDLVCSNRLSEVDAAALVSAIVERPRWRRRPWAQFAAPSDSASACPDLLASLVASERVRIKIAFLEPEAELSLYHEKIGLFEGRDGHVVAMSGSANESRNAWISNFERVDTFIDWGEPSEVARAAAISLAFDQLWSNRTRGLEVLALVDAILGTGLVSSPTEPATPSSLRRLPRLIQRPSPEVLVPPIDIRLLAHQHAAIQAWAQNDGVGILEMATGSGKTHTALHLASRLYDAVGPGLAVVVVAPLIHLVDQWLEAAATYGMRPIRCAEGYSSWAAEAGAALDSLRAKARPLTTLVTTNATFASRGFQALFSRARSPVLLIADEVHNLGSKALSGALPPTVRYRLGLSATPDRWFDRDGTERLGDYFGPVVFKYELRDAIQDGILVPYRYYPTAVALTDDEFDTYEELSLILSRYSRGANAEGDLPEVVKSILIKRARIIGAASGKLPRLRSMLATQRDSDHLLIYCGDGSIEGPLDGSLMRQVVAVTRMLGEDLGIRCASYTADTPPAVRQRHLAAFNSGDIQALVAIRCLDEGVDIPSTRTAYLLASSTNPRQFIQRRGRVLRRHPSKQRAEIYDLFVSPPSDAMKLGSPQYATARGLVKAQVPRVSEFASLAENGPIARRMLAGILGDLHLLDAWERDDG